MGQSWSQPRRWFGRKQDAILTPIKVLEDNAKDGPEIHAKLQLLQSDAYEATLRHTASEVEERIMANYCRTERLGGFEPLDRLKHGGVSESLKVEKPLAGNFHALQCQRESIFLTGTVEGVNYSFIRRTTHCTETWG